jgi:hypothetical protein
MQRVYPGLSPNIPEGWVMAPRPIKRKTPTAGFQVAVEKSASKTLNNRNPCVGVRSIHSRFHTRPVLFHRRTDANTQTHGAVNPLAQIKGQPRASSQPLAGQPGRTGRTSLAGQRRVCARGSCGLPFHAGLRCNRTASPVGVVGAGAATGWQVIWRV